MATHGEFLSTSTRRLQHLVIAFACFQNVDKSRINQKKLWLLGVYRGFLWYRTETQGNEGADEVRAWSCYWSPSELSELTLIRRCGKDMTLIENSAMDVSDFESSPDHSPFKPRLALEERARNDFDAFIKLATRVH
ncbi:hypothetical protein PsorP6_014160 [Peronosclerospora sorghi]|uniref:Uncharacterized protein n=1 Tax=Peronosclerospora sorghi TaxID=230839 RepID=A0ACC0VHU8_9STRA|nr:hypothetical protein PsorP6_014160 [Peronosclerospora sorghi]